MGDGMSNAAKLMGEAVVKPVSDEVGKMVEMGVQSITGAPSGDDNQKTQDKPDPQKIAQDDAAKKRKALANIQQFNTQMTQNAKTVQQQNEQKEQTRKQEEVQETQKIRQFEFAKKQESNQRQVELQRAKTRSERKGSIGG